MIIKKRERERGESAMKINSTKLHGSCRGCAASRRKFHFLESRKCVWYLSGKCGETRK